MEKSEWGWSRVTDRTEDTNNTGSGDRAWALGCRGQEVIPVIERNPGNSVLS